MVQKIIIGILAAALIAVCSIWGYSAWQAKQAAAPVVAPIAAAAAVPVKPVEAITPPADVVPVAAEVPAEKADGTHFTYEYVSPRNPDLLPM
ncbi:MAG: hypothetical protein JF591_21390, partial [Lysobacter sp.]|nr:hypothetical protein [Lysobacter sp.]